ncbi:MAG: hypothetical protein ACI8QC_001243 [Planctomycetota bacterium]|jgi:hypothetical protein
MLNLYPPMFFMRARVVHLADGFKSCTVVVRRSLLTRNLHGSTFGGAVFSGADPIYPMLPWQAMAARHTQRTLAGLGLDRVPGPRAQELAHGVPPSRPL